MTIIAGHTAESENIIDRISTAAGAFAGWIMVAISAFIGYEILSRAFFSEPTVWVYDISTYSLVWFSFIAAGFVLKEKKHLNVDLIISQCSPRVRAASELLALALMMAFIGFILVYAYGATVRAYASGELEPTIIRTPVYAVMAGMVLGLLIFFLQIIREIVKTAGSWRTLPPADPSRSVYFRSPLAFLLPVFIGAGAGMYLLLNDWPGLGLFVLLVSLLLSGVPVFTCLGVAGTIGIFFVFGTGGFPQLAQISYKATHSNTLLAVPLYVLAGQILLAGRIGPELFNFAAAWIGHIRGGFAVATVLACGVFAAISGSSIATAAAIGILAVPEMLKRGYKPHFAYGIVAAGGTLGILIPPSTPMILYSGMTDESTGALFMAGVVPGVLLLILFSLYVVWASEKSTTPAASMKERVAATKEAIWGVLAPVIILVGIYTGAFTPTEAAAVAVLYGLVVGLLRKTIRLRDLQSVMAEGILSSGMIMMIIVGAILLGMITTVLQLPQSLLDFVQEMNISRWAVMAVLVVIYIILGMFLEVVSILLITLPIVYPLITSLGFNGVWFAILLVILMEVSLITPPVGMNLFVVQGITKARLGEVVRGVWPFIILMFIALGLVMAIPDLALWFPSTMGFNR